jgi:hypothetical protein
MTIAVLLAQTVEVVERRLGLWKVLCRPGGIGGCRPVRGAFAGTGRRSVPDRA